MSGGQVILANAGALERFAALPAGFFSPPIDPVPDDLNAASPDPEELAVKIKDAAILALLSGIVSFVLCPPAGFFALIKGKQARDLIEQSGVGQESHKQATIGMVLALISLTIWIAVIGFRLANSLGK